jgi:hypothetical protein
VLAPVGAFGPGVFPVAPVHIFIEVLMIAFLEVDEMDAHARVPATAFGGFGVEDMDDLADHAQGFFHFGQFEHDLQDSPGGENVFGFDEESALGDIRGVLVVKLIEVFELDFHPGVNPKKFTSAHLGHKALSGRLDSDLAQPRPG